MKTKSVVALATALILSLGAGQAWAAGCLKGGAVGAVAGHVAGITRWSEQLLAAR